MESQRQIQDWPIKQIQPHPQNRPVRKNAKFQELLESIKSIGIQQPLIVRAIAGRQDRVELLSGHRRLAAATDAGFNTVPVDHRGEISDAEAFDVMAISNLHEDLSPLEEGQRAALWLDHYDQDARYGGFCPDRGVLPATTQWQAGRPASPPGPSEIQAGRPACPPGPDAWPQLHWNRHKF